MSKVISDLKMIELQIELGYNGFLKELNYLETVILDFINNLPPEADDYIWRHTSRLLEKIIELKTPSYLNSNSCRKRQRFDKFLISIKRFQRKIERKASWSYFKPSPDKESIMTEIHNHVRTWEKLAIQIYHIYIFTL